MKLPLDNFQILGVSPGSSARHILMILERKLEKCNYSGFTQKTLKNRNELLKEYSKSLLDTEKRREIDNIYQNIDPKNDEKRFIVPPQGSEIAGLLLLLESGDYDNCFSIAIELLSLQLQEMSTDDPLIADLYLLIGYATLEYAVLLRSKRHYEYCARVLEKGLALIKDKIIDCNIEQNISRSLEDLIPFRILDLLSREMDEPIRDLGISILDDFVVRRGGLDADSSLCMKDDEFKAFFRQIRYYLTVQEQIDLYQSWCNDGSNSACFLLAISLVASGFARRKPERLVEAQEIIQKLNSNELKEVTDYISLLLGKVDIVEDSSSLLNSKTKKNDDLSSEVALGNLCASCREWLARDVLEGYRDLEADPDLEAYFCDRDVTTFIEKRDGVLTSQNTSNKGFLAPLELGNRLIDRSNNLRRFKLDEPHHPKQTKTTPQTKLIDRKEFLRILQHRWIISALCLFLIFVGWNIFAKHSTEKQINHRKAEIESDESNKKTRYVNTQKSVESLRNIESTNNKSLYPNESDIKAILSEWLRLKGQVLSGLSFSRKITKVATSEAIKRLESERREDMTKREKQLISAQLVDLEILTREPNQIEAMATLKYTDKRVNENGSVIERTPKHVFKKIYILVNRGSGWLVQ